MSYRDAEQHGVRSEIVNGWRMYYPLCGFCGNETPSRTYIPGRKYTCARCRPLVPLLLDLGLFPIDHAKRKQREQETKALSGDKL